MAIDIKTKASRVALKEKLYPGDPLFYLYTYSCASTINKQVGHAVYMYVGNIGQQYILHYVVYVHVRHNEKCIDYLLFTYMYIYPSIICLIAELPPLLLLGEKFCFLKFFLSFLLFEHFSAFLKYHIIQIFKQDFSYRICLKI